MSSQNPDLGPMFGTDAITGPILVQYIQWHGLKLYLIGEEHFTNGTPSRDKIHVIEQLLQYSKRHKTRCYTELSPTEMKYHFDSTTLTTAKSPLGVYAHYWWNGMFPGHDHKLIFSDTRKLPPYDIYNLIVYPVSFAFEHFGFKMSSHVMKVRKLSKQAEKEVFKHVATREKAKEFLESLVMPDKSYAQWFVKLYKDINETDDDPPSLLRTQMTELRTRSPTMYERLVRHIDGYYGAWSTSPYTAAFERIESMRKTANTKVVVELHSPVRAVFDEMTTHLMDVYILLDLLLDVPSAKETVVVLSGANHSTNLARFFAEDSQIHFKFNKNGNITQGNAINQLAYIVPKVPNILRELRNKK